MSSDNKPIMWNILEFLDFAKNRKVVSHRPACFDFYETITFDDGSRVIVQAGKVLGNTVFLLDRMAEKESE